MDEYVVGAGFAEDFETTFVCINRNRMVEKIDMLVTNYQSKFSGGIE